MLLCFECSTISLSVSVNAHFDILSRLFSKGDSSPLGKFKIGHTDPCFSRFLIHFILEWLFIAVLWCLWSIVNFNAIFLMWLQCVLQGFFSSVYVGIYIVGSLIKKGGGKSSWTTLRAFAFPKMLCLQSWILSYIYLVIWMMWKQLLVLFCVQCLLPSTKCQKR